MNNKNQNHPSLIFFPSSSVCVCVLIGATRGKQVARNSPGGPVWGQPRGGDTVESLASARVDLPPAWGWAHDSARVRTYLQTYGGTK